MSWWQHVLGVDDLSGSWYGFWSGFGSDLAYFGAIGIFLRRHNCHCRGCWRMGLHKVDGTHYTTCRRHHPRHDGSKPATADEIARQSHAADLD